MADYTEVVEKIEGLMTDFVTEAKAGEVGHGSKTSGLKARKLSNSITRELKDFRKASVENDKNK